MNQRSMSTDYTVSHGKSFNSMHKRATSVQFKNTGF